MRIFLFRQILLTLTLFLISEKGYSQVLIHDSVESFSVSNHLYYSIQNNCNINDIITLYKQGKMSHNIQGTNNLNLGISYNSYWICIPTQNISTREIGLELCIPNPNIQKINFYQLDSNYNIIKNYNAGTHLAFSSRPISNRNFIFPFSIESNTFNLLVLEIKIPNAYFFAPVLLNKAGNFEKEDTPIVYFYIVFISTMLFIIIIAIVLAIIFEEFLYLLYAAYILFSTLFILSIEGLDFELFYPTTPELAKTSNPVVFACIALLSLLYFTIYFFNSHNNNKFINMLINIWKLFIFVFFIGLCLMHFMDFEFGFYYQFDISFSEIFYLGFICVTWVMILIIIFYAIAKKMNNATLYFVSTLGLIIAVSYTLLFSITKIQRIYIPVNMMPISFSFEVILLSIVLIYRFRNTENQKKKLENELKKEQLLSAGYQITIQEKERSRIAKDLHDEIGSNLANLKMQLDQLDNKDPQTASKISSMLEVISITNKSLSAITYNLMPPSFNTTPFPSVLNTFFEKIKNNKSIYFEFYIHNYLQAFKKEDELIIYRILLELSHNIIKHSKANSASVQLIYTRNSVNIIAEDNGIGIENQKKGLGLESINSRVKYLEGTIEIDSTTSGTLISISIPYKSKQL